MAKRTPPFPPYPTLQSIVLDRSIPEPNTGCWIWLLSFSSNGYGQVSINGKMRTAHRVSYEAFKGPLKNWALHTCDNRWCVNPDHLYDGTVKDNSKDAVERGSHKKGMDCSYTNKTIRTFQHTNGETFKGTVNEFYRKYGLCRSSVWRMVNGGRPSAYGWSLVNA